MIAFGVAVVAADGLDLDAGALRVHRMDQPPVTHRALLGFRHFFRRDTGVDFDDRSASRRGQAPASPRRCGFWRSPRWRHRHHPTGLGTARLQAIEIGLRPIAMLVVLDAEPGDLGVDRRRDLLLRRSISARLSVDAPMMLKAPQVSMQAMGLRSEA